MAYIGTTPTKVVSRQSVVDYRYIATEGQTAFTGADLNNQVLACNPADMDVYLNGVRLDLTDWSATATTLTLAVAATAGDEVTVAVRQTFEVADTYAKTTADDRFVNAAGDTMTGTLSVTGGRLYVGQTAGDYAQFGKDTNGNAFIDATQSDADFGIYINSTSTGYNKKLGIDSAGRVTMPYQPFFKARSQPNVNISVGGQTLPFDVVDTNIGGHYNGTTYTFTAPVGGRYVFNVMLFTPPSTTSWNYFTVNGTRMTSIEQNDAPTNYTNRSDTFVAYLAAGDYVHMMHWSGTTHLNGTLAGPHSYFSGYLIG